MGFKIDFINLGAYTEVIGRKFYFVVNSPNELANRYKNKINVTLNDKRGSILSITSTGFVPEQEADYLNKLMVVYIRSGLEDKNRIAENTINFIDKQLIDVSDSLRVAEQKLQNFRINNKIIDLSAEGNLLFEKLKAIQEQKASSELKRRYYSYLLDYLQKRSNLKDIVAPSSLGVEDPQLSMLLDQISQTYIQREELLLTTNPGSPALSQIDSRLANLNRTLIEKVSSLIDANQLNTQDIDGQLANIEKEMLRIPASERMLINTEREFNLMNKQYTYLLEKRAEAGIAKASNIADNKVLDFAIPDNALLLKPNKKLNNLLGLLLGMLLPFSVILAINFLNDKIIDLKEIGRMTATPILGSVGHNKFNSELPVVDKPKSTLTESFRGIRTNLQFMLRDPNQKVIAVTSTISGEGKTFITANLAAIIASTDKKVLIVGLDLRKPKLQSIFGANIQKGLSTYLIGRDKEEDIVQPTHVENLFYAPSGPIPPNPAELIGSPRMSEFITWAKANFDYIVIDTPPIAIVTDALLAHRFSDVTLFVIRFKYSNKDVLHFVESLNTTDEKKSVGIIINDLQHKRVYGYNYGYTYTYGYSYSGYGYYNDRNGYYTDEEPPLTFKEKALRFFS
jgi:capsular exopolysaccharide synthesis family protein